MVAASLAQQRDNLDMAENRRHDREMARIRRLTGPDRVRAETIENQRVAEYEQQRNPQSSSPKSPLRSEEPKPVA